MSKKGKLYSVGAMLAIYSTIEIEATSLADAVEQAKSLGIDDFVKVVGSHDDSSMKVHSVSSTGWLPNL